MIVYLLLGFALGAAATYIRLRVVGRRARDIDEDRHRISQRKGLVVQFMHDMVAALGEGLSRDELYHRIAHAALGCTGALSACVFEVTADGKLQGRAVEGLFPPQRRPPAASRDNLATRATLIEQVLRSERLEIGDGVIGQVAANRRGELVVDGSRDERIIDFGDRAFELQTMIAVPMLFRDELAGVLAIANSIDGSPFTQEDFLLMQSLAEHAGLAIHNDRFLQLQVEKRRLDLDLALARSVQMMLIPEHLPRMEGIDIDARYIPADSVGGDLLDVMQLDDDRLAVVVADVSGKGVAASLTMAICRTHLRHALRKLGSPSAALREVNRLMAGEIRHGTFVTGLLAVVEPRLDRIVFARAGHEAPILCARESDAEGFRASLVLSEGMALGMVDPDTFDPVIEDRVVPFFAEDIFVLYTDGVTEATNSENEEFSTVRLMDAVRTLRRGSCVELTGGILESVERFAESGVKSDDLTLVAIKRLAG